MRAVITVIGKDRKGIIAGVSGELAASGINILDISQTTLQEYFAMIMLVDMTDATKFFMNQEKTGKQLARLGIGQSPAGRNFKRMHQV